MVKGDAFGAKKTEFAGESVAAGLAEEASGREVGGDDAVAGDGGSQRIGAEGLPDGPRGTAAEATRKGGVGDDPAARNKTQGVVDPGGEGGGLGGRFALGLSRCRSAQI